ncbi:MAG: LTA synthase family protein, partial [Muribaculaceae bacterium]|nr:LTA synthase family protein [Muribaculaceae bacterium]
GYPKTKKNLYRILTFLVAAGGTFICIRGHLGPGRPLSIGDAAWGTSEAPQLNIVLNTPFCIIRTLHNDNRLERLEFYTAEELSLRRSSLHKPDGKIIGQRLKKNIFILTIESGSPIWIDNLNPVAGDTVRGLMPFLDSLARKSAVFTRAYTTGVRSIEGISAIFGGVPTFNELILMTSPYYANTFDSPARLLGKTGYSSRFYFGGNKGSFNIDQTLKAFGFDQITGREEYGNDKDFDGVWGILDHKMGEYAARDLSSLPQPFIAGWFTLNPHGPFRAPGDLQSGGYKSSDNMRLTVEYEDRAIRRFFEVAGKQPWYDNTIFIIIGDHGCRDLSGTIYDSAAILPRITMMIYTPDGSLPPVVTADRCVSQYDIAPTLLNMVGYSSEYIALGEDVMSDQHSGYAIMYIKGGWQICSPRYLVRLSEDLNHIEGVYGIEDYALQHNLENYDVSEIKDMMAYAQAFMQDYSERLNSNTLYTR